MFNSFNLFKRLQPMMDAAGEPGAGGTDPKPGTDPKTDPKPGTDPAPGTEPAKTDPEPKPGKSFSQEQLDEIITKRLVREQKKWQDQIDEDKRKAELTEAEKLKEGKAEAEAKVKTITAAANKRLVQAEAKVAASALGVKAEKIPYLLKLANLTDVTVDEDGTVDAAFLKTELENILKDLPELKGSTQNPNPVGGASNPAGGGNPGQKLYTKVELEKMSSEEINAHWTDIQEQMSKGLIR